MKFVNVTVYQKTDVATARDSETTVLLKFLGKNIGSRFSLFLKLMSSQFAGSVMTECCGKDLNFDHVRIELQILLTILSLAKIACNVLGKTQENSKAKYCYGSSRKMIRLQYWYIFRTRIGCALLRKLFLL